MPQVATGFKHFAGDYFPVFEVSTVTLALQVACAAVVAIAAAIIPAWRAARVRIVEGLRAIG
jgi:putative ABC transport system permease protein